MLIHALLRARGPALAAAVLAAVTITACGGDGDGGLLAGQTVSGTVTIPEGTLADADTNDPATGTATNNAPGEAQDLQNPATVGGFVAAEATGEFHDGENDPLPADRFAENPDPSDYYNANLADGQSVTLSNVDVPDPETNDSTTNGQLVLHLLDTETDEVLSSSSVAAVGDTVGITVPGSSDYHIQVEAQSGTGVYQLSVDSPGYICDAGSTSTAFVPGEVLVRLAEGTAAATNTERGGGDLASTLGMRPTGHSRGRTQLWNMGDPAQAHARLRTLGLADSPLPLSRTSTGNSEQAQRARTLTVIRALKKHPDIELAVPNYIYESLQTATPPDDFHFSRGDQWNLDRINVPLAWETSTGTDVDSGDPVVIGVLDTGVNAAHEDLQGSLSGDGYDFIGDDSTPDDFGIFHGSHVAGIAAATTDNVVGIAGVGWDAEITPVKVLGETGGTLEVVLAGAKYAAGMEPDADGQFAEHPAQIINMSLGGTGGCIGDDDSRLFDEVRRGPDGQLGTGDDVILIAASGNNGDSVPVFPASYSSVISVSAINNADARADYSSFGPFVDVAAPGGDDSASILSTVGPTATDYGFLAGTSMAAPHIAGVAALMKAVYPGLNTDIFETALKQGRLTEDLLEDGLTTRNDEFGYGLIDADKAVQWANEGNRALDPMVTARPETIYFEPDTTATLTEPLTIRESSGADLSTLGAITVTDDADSPDWLTTTETAEGEYEVEADPSAVTGDGTFRATITVDTADGGSTTVPVLMRKGVRDVHEDASVQYILLINPDADPENQVVRQTARRASNSTYSFTFENVPDGSYFLVSGSDMDNNGYICTANEACGIYPEVITVNGSAVNNRDFTTQFGAISPGNLPESLTAPRRIEIRKY